MTFNKIIEENFKKGPVRFIAYCAVSIIVGMFFYWRTDAQKGSAFTMQQLSNCEANLKVCQGERIEDIRKYGQRVDSLLVKVFELKYEIEEIKNNQ